MEFCMKADDLRTVKNEIRTRLSEWQELTERIRENQETFGEQPDFNGKAAESIRLYLKEVHGILIGSLQTAMAVFSTQLTLYGDRYGEIDSGIHAVLKKGTLEKAQRDYSGSREELEDIQNRLERIAGDIRDLLYLPTPSVWGLQDGLRQAEDTAKNLIQDVEDHEEATCSGQIRQLRELLDTLRASIREYRSKGPEFAVRYQSGDFAYATNIMDLAVRLDNAQNYLDSNQENLLKAIENEEDVYEALEAEAAQAREEAGILQMVIGGAIIAGSVAMMVVTLGAAAPVSIAVTAGVVGAMSTTYGLAEFHEGTQEFWYGSQGDVTTRSVNMVRDTIFQGNQEAYDCWGSIAVTCTSLIVPATAGWQAAKIGGKSVILSIGKEILKDQAIEFVSDQVGSGAADFLGEEFGLKNYQKEILKMGLSFAAEQGIEKGIDTLAPDGFRGQMEGPEQKRYDEYWMQKRESLDNGTDMFPSNLNADEIARMRRANSRLDQEMAYNQIDGDELLALRRQEIAPAELKNSDTFTWTVKGEEVTLENIEMREIAYVKRNRAEYEALRDDFDSGVKKEFLTGLGEDPEYLRSKGFSETEIRMIQDGKSPDGWQVHHKLPLDDGGTNDLDNLVLIQNHPSHKAVTNYQNSFSRNMEEGETRTVNWPVIQNRVYP